jgi:hypothetical protein
MSRPSQTLRTAGAALLLVAGMAGMAGVVSAAEPAAAPESGVWQKHDVRFDYMGFTTIYTCDGLADKLKLLLMQAGARADAKARTGACAEVSGRPDRMANARLVYYTLAPAGAGSASSDVVPAQWRKVTLSVDHPRDLQAGDCELIEQFRDAVVKKTFTTRNLAGRITCVPHQIAGTRFTLEFEALVEAK